MKTQITLCSLTYLFLTATPASAATYTNVVPLGVSYLCNQLDHGSNTADVVLPNSGGQLDGSSIVKWNCSGYTTYYYDSFSSTGFSDTGGNPVAAPTLPPGVGFGFNNQTAPNLALVFTGTPHVPVLPPALPCSCGNPNLLGRQTNGPGNYTNIVGLQPRNGAQEQIWNGASFNTYTFTNGAWTPSNPPALGIGQSAFFRAPCETRPNEFERMNLTTLLESLTSGASRCAEFLGAADFTNSTWSGDYTASGWTCNVSGTVGGGSFSISYVGSRSNAWGQDIVNSFTGTGYANSTPILIQGSMVWKYNAGKDDYIQMDYSDLSKFGTNTLWGWVAGGETAVGVGVGVAVGVGVGSLLPPAGVVAGVKAGAEATLGCLGASVAIKELLSLAVAPPPQPPAPGSPNFNFPVALAPWDTTNIVTAVDLNQGTVFAYGLGTATITGNYASGHVSGTVNPVKIARLSGIDNVALGNATLSVESNQVMRVSDLRPNGADGVQANLGQALSCEVGWQNLTNGPGAGMRMDFTGSVTGAPNRSLGYVGTVRTGTNLDSYEISASLAAIGSPTVRAEVWRQGTQVAVHPGQPNGLVARASSWPSGGGKLGLNSFPYVLGCIVERWPLPIDIWVGGNHYVGDELRMLQESPAVVDYISAVSIVGSNMGGLKIIHESAVRRSDDYERMVLTTILESLTSGAARCGEFLGAVDFTNSSWSGNYTSSNWTCNVTGSVGGGAFSLNYSGTRSNVWGQNIVVSFTGTGYANTTPVLIQGSMLWKYNGTKDDYVLMDYKDLSKFGTNTVWGWVAGGETAVGVGVGVAVGVGVGSLLPPAGVVAGVKAGVAATGVLLGISAAYHDLLSLAVGPPPEPPIPGAPNINFPVAVGPWDTTNIVTGMNLNQSTVFAYGLGTARLTGSYGAGQVSGTVSPVKTARFAGLENSALGNATLSVESNQVLMVRDLRTNGTDGVNVQFERSLSCDVGWKQILTNAPVSSWLEMEFFGSITGAPNRSLGFMRVTHDTANQDGYAISASLAPLGSATERVEVWRQGTNVAVFPGTPNGIIARSPWWPRGGGKLGLGSYPYVLGCIVMRWPFPTTIWIQGIPYVGDELRALQESPAVVDYLSGVNIQMQKIPDLNIIEETVTRQPILFSGFVNTPLGNAALGVVSNKLAVTNLDYSGQDGFSVALGHAQRCDLAWSPVPAGSLGSWMQLDFTGSITGAPNRAIGYTRITRDSTNNDGYAVVADLGALGSGTVRVEVWSQGVPQAVFPGVPAGIIGRVGRWPSGGGKLGLGGWPYVLGCIVWPFPYPTDIWVGSGHYLGDELRMLQESPAVVDYISAVSLRSANVPGFSITQETSEIARPSLRATLTGNNLSVRWSVAGALQQSTDLVNWNDVVGATNPYNTTASGARRFFRVRD